MTDRSPAPPLLERGQETLTPGQVTDFLGRTRVRAFPTKAQIQRAVAAIPTTTDKAWRQHNGARYRLELSPGSGRITSTDYSRSAKTDNAAAERKLRKTAGMLIEEMNAAREHKRGEIKDFSEKSRARMPLRFATLDYAAMFEQGQLACMVTLTYPQDWHRLVPDAATFKAQVNLLRKRYFGSWGRGESQWAGIWKMEFQRRGAPHFHVGTVVPEGTRPAPLSADDQQHLTECSSCGHGAHTGRFTFQEWMSRHWSQIIFKDVQEAPSPWSIEGWQREQVKSQRAGTGVDEDEGLRYSDPKRIGIYFAKHGLFGDKEYQNVVPELWREKPGARFWGYWVVRPLIVSKEIHESLIMHIMSTSNPTIRNKRDRLQIG